MELVQLHLLSWLITAQSTKGLFDEMIISVSNFYLSKSYSLVLFWISSIAIVSYSPG
jgi:hypothetical protein